MDIIFYITKNLIILYGVSCRTGLLVCDKSSKNMGGFLFPPIPPLNDQGLRPLDPVIRREYDFLVYYDRAVQILGRHCGSFRRFGFPLVIILLSLLLVFSFIRIGTGSIAAIAGAVTIAVVTAVVAGACAII